MSAQGGGAYGAAIPEGLHEAIETERGNLAKAESLLGCLVMSMEYETDSTTAPYYPDVARLARDLVRQSINGLDSLSLQRCLSRNKVKEESGPPITGATYSILARADLDDTSRRASPLHAKTVAASAAERENLAGGYRIFDDLFAQNDDVAGGVHPDSDLTAPDFQNRYANIVSNLNRLCGSSGQNKHDPVS